MLDYLRRYPAQRPEDIAADGRAATVLLAELRWRIVEHEHIHLRRLDRLPVDVRPTNSTVGRWLGTGLHRQSVRDRRDRDAALLQLGPGNDEHDWRERRRAQQHQHASTIWLAEHTSQLHDARARLLALVEQHTTELDLEATDWMAELSRDHREQATGHQALVVLGLTAEAVDHVLTNDELDAITTTVQQLRSAYRAAKDS